MSLGSRIVDYHIHSTHSWDGKSSILEICRKAVELGIAEIGFSEHMDFDPTDQGFGFFNYDEYTYEIKKAQRWFSDRLILRKGIEIDYQHRLEGKIRRWLRGKRFDLTIGSVHYVDRQIINHQLATSGNLMKLYDAYFSEVTRSIESGLFDVIGHFDLVRRYVVSRRLKSENVDYWEKMKKILKRVMENGIYLEVNSKGLREEINDTTPGRRVLEEYIKNDGRLISIGSDAHSVKEVGNGLDEIMRYLANLNGHRVKLPFQRSEN